jgi:hypothetical protein
VPANRVRKPTQIEKIEAGTGANKSRLAGLEVAMPLYHINLRTEEQVWNTADVEADNLDQLRIKMAQFAGELLKGHAGKVWQDEDWRVDVTDEAGLILYVIHISASDTAATRQPAKRGS